MALCHAGLIIMKRHLFAFIFHDMLMSLHLHTLMAKMYRKYHASPPEKKTIYTLKSFLTCRQPDKIL